MTEDNRALPTGSTVTCPRCDGRGWVLFDTGKRRPYDTECGTCLKCKGAKTVVIPSRHVWTIFLSNTAVSLEWVQREFETRSAGADGSDVYAFSDWLKKRADLVPRPNVTRDADDR